VGNPHLLVLRFPRLFAGWVWRQNRLRELRQVSNWPKSKYPKALSVPQSEVSTRLPRPLRKPGPPELEFGCCCEWITLRHSYHVWHCIGFQSDIRVQYKKVCSNCRCHLVNCISQWASCFQAQEFYSWIVYFSTTLLSCQKRHYLPQWFLMGVRLRERDETFLKPLPTVVANNDSGNQLSPCPYPSGDRQFCRRYRETSQTGARVPLVLFLAHQQPCLNQQASAARIWWGPLQLGKLYNLFQLATISLLPRENKIASSAICLPEELRAEDALACSPNPDVCWYFSTL